MRYHEKVSDSAQPLIIPLRDAHAELSQVGEHYRFLAQIAAKQLPVAPLYFLTPGFLSQLGEHNNLGEVLRHALPQAEADQQAWQTASEEIQAQVHQFHYSPELTKELLAAYIRWWEDKSIDISFVDPHRHHTRPHLVEQLIAGESNLSLSILRAWGEWYSPKALKHRAAELKQARFTYPLLVIRPRAAVIASGEAFTLHPQLHHKSRVLLKATWGEVAPPDQNPSFDWIEVDVRTFQPVHRQPSVKLEQFVLKNNQLISKAVPKTQQTVPCLSDEQAAELARLCFQVKQLTVHHIHLKWQLTATGLEITEVRQVQDQHELADSPAVLTPPQPTLALGQVIVKGYVTSQAQILTSPREISSFMPGRIAIIPELSAEWLPLLPRAAALVCEGGIQSSALLQVVKEYRLPTLIQTKQVSTLLRKSPYLTVNALKGSVQLATPTDVRQVQEQHRAKTASASVSSHPANASVGFDRHQSLPTLTKVLVTATSSQQADQLKQPGVDGVGLLKSEYAMAQFGSHPLHLLKTPHHSKLKRALTELIRTYAPTQADQPFIYRSQNFTSGELQQLSNSTAYEQSEPNPFLGFRGGIRLLHTRPLLELELESLYETSQRLQRSVGLLLPFVRTPAEFQLLKRQVETYYQDQHPGHQVPMWLQVNTPANVSQFQEFLEAGISGASLNTKTLFALWYGLDPDNPDVYRLYAFDSELIHQTIRQLHHLIQEHHQRTGHKVALLLHLEEPRTELITLAAELNLAGVVVKPNFAKTAKQLIIDVQHAQLHIE